MVGAGSSGDAGGPIDSSFLGPSSVEEEKRRALDNPGRPWKEWFYFTALKWWIGVLFLVVDSWLVATFLASRSWGLMAASILAAVYLEYLAYGYLWHEPDPAHRPRTGRLRWPPFEVGRWTPEGVRLRSGRPYQSSREKVPDHREFF